MISIHDPIHGTIEVSSKEIKLVDARPVQRLRYIRQTGFAELAFPGATHTRYAHSLGAMQMATRMLDRVLPSLGLGTQDITRFRQAVRLAVLFHDLGHPPLSHVSEAILPQVKNLNLGTYLRAQDDPERRATHEDYTIKLLIDSELTPLIHTCVGDLGVTAGMLAALVMGWATDEIKASFVVEGVNYLPLLSQIVSSELDADRMDYLRRDAYYCGVSYGNFDHLWLTQNLCGVLADDQLVLGLLHKGVWAFENFLLARYHMFLAVYYHHTPICFDHLLGNYYRNEGISWPADTDAYLSTDDVMLLAALRLSDDRWAKSVVRRRAYRLLIETHDHADEKMPSTLSERLTDAKVDFFTTRSTAILSKYFRRAEAFTLRVLEPEIGRVRRIEEYTPLYRRFADAVQISRVYCRPEDLTKARACLAP